MPRDSNVKHGNWWFRIDELQKLAKKRKNVTADSARELTFRFRFVVVGLVGVERRKKRSRVLKNKLESLREVSRSSKWSCRTFNYTQKIVFDKKAFVEWPGRMLPESENRQLCGVLFPLSNRTSSSFQHFSQQSKLHIRTVPSRKTESQWKRPLLLGNDSGLSVNLSFSFYVDADQKTSNLREEKKCQLCLFTYMHIGASYYAPSTVLNAFRWARCVIGAFFGFFRCYQTKQPSWAREMNFIPSRGSRAETKWLEEKKKRNFRWKFSISWPYMVSIAWAFYNV